MKLTPFKVSPRQLHELIVMPMFGDVLDTETGSVTIPSDEEGDWAIMDDVVVERPILDVFGNQNILKRRDATCKLVASPAGRMGARFIRTTKLYVKLEDCVEEFYQGAFEDFSNENYDIIFENVMPMTEKALATDLYTNKYFGDVSRASDVNGKWSWNKFDGIFTHIAKYVAEGIIPAEQTYAINEGTLTPTQANAALQDAYDRQDVLFLNFDDDDKIFYVDKKLSIAYYDYLIQSGQTVLMERMSGQPVLYFKGIRVKVKKWDGVLAALNNNTQAHAVILTLKGNFLYGTDSAYGGGPKRNEAIRVWYSDDDGVWKREIHTKAATELIAPQHVVLGITEL